MRLWALLCLLALPAQAQLYAADQGPAWNAAERQAFYTQDQGSRLMPLAWLMALRGADGRPFLQDGLNRFGYLGETGRVGLPIGFTTGEWDGVRYAGMTCSACHTRQIDIGPVTYRIDGGPAFADFGAFLTALDTATQRVLTDGAAFAGFAGAVGGDSVALRASLAAWAGPFHTLMQGALPRGQPWGPGRLDAVGMILNRLTALDIGTGADRVIAANIHEAGAPTRYPFLWNAARQDRTQWPGFAGNGSDTLALGRNVGEVYGVFGVFQPKPWFFATGINYKGENSVNFQGLNALEQRIKLIGPPRFPGPIDAGLAAQGEEVWSRATASGGCVECHGIRPGEQRAGGGPTWATPVRAVGTDRREWANMAWQTTDAGVMNGASIPFVANDRLQPAGPAVAVLQTAVLGAIIEHIDPLATGRSSSAPFGLEEALARAYRGPDEPKPELFSYEARVLQGIWAAAPYLHNGSVPTLADLLEPPARRPARFQIGPAYDLDRVGLSTAQAPGPTLVTTGCEDLNSGNSRCGHPYGTALPASEKRALLEFLKRL